MATYLGTGISSIQFLFPVPFPFSVFSLHFQFSASILFPFPAFQYVPGMNQKVWKSSAIQKNLGKICIPSFDSLSVRTTALWAA